MQVIQILRSDFRYGDVVNIDFLLSDKVQQQIERPFIHRDVNLVRCCHTHAPFMSSPAAWPPGLCCPQPSALRTPAQDLQLQFAFSAIQKPLRAHATLFRAKHFARASNPRPEAREPFPDSFYSPAAVPGSARSTESNCRTSPSCTRYSQSRQCGSPVPTTSKYPAAKTVYASHTPGKRPDCPD